MIHDSAQETEQSLQSQSVIEVDMDNVNLVFQESANRPVLLDFWADWCEPCKQLAPILDELADAYQGQFLLAKVDAETYAPIAQQLGVRGLPNLKLISQGQLVGELDGLQTKQDIVSLLEKADLDLPAESAEPVDPVLAEVAQATDAGDIEAAKQLLSQAIAKDEQAGQYQLALIELMTDEGEFSAAKGQLEVMSSGLPEKKQAQAYLALAELCEVVLETKEGAADLSPADADFMGALKLVKQKSHAEACQKLLELVKKPCQSQWGGAKQPLLDLCTLMGPQDPVAKDCRRQLFGLIY